MNLSVPPRLGLLALAATLLVPAAQATRVFPTSPTSSADASVNYFDGTSGKLAGSYELFNDTVPSAEGDYATTPGGSLVTLTSGLVTSADEVGADQSGTLITPGDMGDSTGVNTEAWSNGSSTAAVYLSATFAFILSSPTVEDVPIDFSGALATGQGGGWASAYASIEGFSLDPTSSGEYLVSVPETDYYADSTTASTVAFDDSVTVQSGPTVFDSAFPPAGDLPEYYYLVSLTDIVEGPGFAYAIDDPQVSIDPSFALDHPEVSLINVAPLGAAPDTTNTLVLGLLAFVALAGLSLRSKRSPLAGR